MTCLSWNCISFYSFDMREMHPFKRHGKTKPYTTCPGLCCCVTWLHLNVHYNVMREETQNLMTKVANFWKDTARNEGMSNFVVVQGFRKKWQLLSYSRLKFFFFSNHEWQTTGEQERRTEWSQVASIQWFLQQWLQENLGRESSWFFFSLLLICN